MIYQWHEARRHKADPQQIGELVEELSKSGSGHQTAPALVEAARDATSPAHDLFEWDDSLAGEQWRVHQARRIIGSLQVEVLDSRGETALTPAFYHVRVNESGEVHEGYRPQVEVLANENFRQQALAEALRYLNGFRRRFRQLEELKPLFDVIDEIIETNGDDEDE